MPNVAGGPLVFHPSYCFKHSKTYNTWARLSVTTVLELKTRSGFEGLYARNICALWTLKSLLHPENLQVGIGQNLYFLLNHPIRWVRLVGVIVAFDPYPNRVVMTLDDSSGSTIEIYCKKDPIKKPVVDTTVDSNGVIQLNGQADLSVDHEHTCITNEGHTVNLKGIDVGSVVKVKGGVSEFRGEKQITLEPVIGTTNEEALAWTENAAFYNNTLSQPWLVSESLRREAKREALGLDGEKEAKEKRGRKEREEKLQRKAKKHDEHPTGKRRQAPKRNIELSEADQVWHKKEVTRSTKAQNVV
ncbi:MAG: hypothetical protein LQ350_002013 [Teloschistes chrysophthalmus]|nr:MAG: hypothetical protein LQ350_002013 [Niorma chrysophthalma]